MHMHIHLGIEMTICLVVSRGRAGGQLLGERERAGRIIKWDINHKAHQTTQQTYAYTKN